MKKMILTDHVQLFEFFYQYLEEKEYKLKDYDFRYSPANKIFLTKYKNDKRIKPLNVKKNVDLIINNYDFLFSVHCKQILPKRITKKILCVNIHPGFNPYNRGWYPHVFSIINQKPFGVTLHLIDEQIDHGEIIAQEEIKIENWDTGKEVYEKAIQQEMKMIKKYFPSLINKTFRTKKPFSEGNINLKSDFEKLCCLNLNEMGTYRELINKIRALTHEPYKNAFFYDENGDKIYISINFFRKERVKK